MTISVILPLVVIAVIVVVVVAIILVLVLKKKNEYKQESSDIKPIKFDNISESINDND